jgi:hypothetical protein
MWTLKKHETPQRLSVIMREAWQIKKTERIAFGPALKQAWANARERAGPRLPDPPATLLQFIRGRGGLRPSADLRHVGAPLYVFHRNGLPLDFAARLATDAGYPVHDDANRLLDCIGEETRGRHVLAVHEAPIAAEIAAWRAHHAQLMSDDCPF